MQLSCFPNSYGPFGPLAALDHLPTVGVPFIEMPIKNAGIPSFFKETPLLTNASSLDDAKSVRERVVAAGMKLSSANITSGNPLDADGLQRTLDKLPLAAALGVPFVVAGAGELQSSDDWPTLIDHLRRIGDAAQELNIVYCCETHPGVCVSAARMLETIERVDHPHIRLNFDTGNILYYNDGVNVVDELRAVLPFVEHVHLKDSNGVAGDWHFPALGAGGAVNFTEVLKVLVDAAYNGPVSLEIEGIEGEPELSLSDYQERIAASVRHLTVCAEAAGAEWS